MTPQEETIEETTAGKPGVEKERLNQELAEGRGQIEQKEGSTAENPDSREEVGPLPGPSQETIAETPKFEREEGDQEVAETEEQREQKVAMLEEKPGPVPGSYTVNIASFRVKARADRLVQELRKKGLEAFGWEVDLPEKGKWHRVAVGNFPTLKHAEDFVTQERLRENYSVFITRIPRT